MSLRRLLLIAGVLTLAFLAHAPDRSEPSPQEWTPARPHRAPATAPAGQRTLITDGEPPPPISADAMASHFAALVHELVELALQIHAAVARDDLRTAQRLDQAAQALFQADLASDPSMPERAVRLLNEAPASDARRRQATYTVLTRLLEAGLRQRHAAGLARGSPTQLSQLVDQLLATLVPEAAVGELVAGLLIDQPYLGAEHQDTLLQLTQLSEHFPWLVELTHRLLLTLWHNLEVTGRRTAPELAGLAASLATDHNPALRAAALERLLTSGDPMELERMLADVERQADGAHSRLVANVAARILPPAQALAVLERLSQEVDGGLTGAALMIARRDAPAVRERCEQMRRQGRDANVRAELITGLGFDQTPGNVEFVLAALQLDPDQRVRERALLALTAVAASSHGSDVVAAALDDRTFTSSASGLGVLVAAIDNLARAGEHDTVRRLANRLALHVGQAPHVEQAGWLQDRLGQILASEAATGQR